NSLSVFKWAIRHEKSYQCLLTCVKALVKINSKESRTAIIEQLKKIRKSQFINIDKGYENRKYKESLKPLFKRNKTKAYSSKQLGDVLIDFFTIKQLIDELPNVYFELNSEYLTIEKLDLSDYLEFEVKGTPWGWKNNIKSISKITGLKNLKNLKNLNLSNNRIQDLKPLVEMKSLTHLDLSNNKISDPQNIKYLKQIPLLELIDLRGNDIAKLIQGTEFSENTRILKGNTLIDLEERFEKRFGIK
ncbi:MAG: leucine-rich repeat domain-containing protein, partial [Candidatus Hermodarchaeota archaeon]